MPTETISINRAPVLTLWAAVVAQRLGFNDDEARSLGKALAGLNAQAKGRRLGIFKPHEEKPTKARAKERGEEFFVEMLGRPIPAKNKDSEPLVIVPCKKLELVLKVPVELTWLRGERNADLAVIEIGINCEATTMISSG